MKVEIQRYEQNHHRRKTSKNISQHNIHVNHALLEMSSLIIHVHQSCSCVVVTLGRWWWESAFLKSTLKHPEPPWTVARDPLQSARCQRRRPISVTSPDRALRSAARRPHTLKQQTANTVWHSAVFESQSFVVDVFTQEKENESENGVNHSSSRLHRQAHNVIMNRWWLKCEDFSHCGLICLCRIW